MKTIIHQSFGNILHLHPGTGFEGAHVQNHLVGATVVGIGVQNPVGPFQSVFDVIGVQNGVTGGLC